MRTITRCCEVVQAVFFDHALLIYREHAFFNADPHYNEPKISLSHKITSTSHHATSYSNTMPVKEVKNYIELIDAARTKTPLGNVVIYMYEPGSNVHDQLVPIYEDISRKCPFSTFFTCSIDNLTEDEMSKLGVIVYPSFLIYDSGVQKQKLQASSKEVLYNVMKKAAILKE